MDVIFRFRQKQSKFGFIVLIGLVFTFALPHISDGGQFKVVRVYDGDTLKAQGYDIEIKVRLLGIDSPETQRGKRKPGQPYSQKAKEFLTQMVLNKVVEIKGYGLGPYNRTLGVVYLDGVNVNLEIVKAGLAEVYHGNSPRKFDIKPYLLAESEAKNTERGMWFLGDRYISPKDWRRFHKN